MPFELAQEAKAEATAITTAKITIVFLILWYLIIENNKLPGQKGIGTR